MVVKRADRAAKRVEDLRAKGMSAKQAIDIKGGVIAIISYASNARGAGELLPYMEKKGNS